MLILMALVVEWGIILAFYMPSVTAGLVLLVLRGIDLVTSREFDQHGALYSVNRLFGGRCLLWVQSYPPVPCCVAPTRARWGWQSYQLGWRWYFSAAAGALVDTVCFWCGRKC